MKTLHRTVVFSKPRALCGIESITMIGPACQHRRSLDDKRWLVIFDEVRPPVVRKLAMVGDDAGRDETYLVVGEKTGKKGDLPGWFQEERVSWMAYREIPADVAHDATHTRQGRV